MNERIKAFSTNWFFEGDLEEQQKLLKGRKTALLSTKKKIKEYQAIMCLPYLSDLGGHFSVR